MKNILTTTISSFLYFYVFSYVFKARVNESKILILEKQKNKLNFHLKTNIPWRFRQSVIHQTPWEQTRTDGWLAAMTSDLHGRKPTRTSPLKEWIPPPPAQRKQGSRKQARAVHRKGGSREVSRLLWLLVLVHLFIFFSLSFLGIKTKSEWAAAAAGLDRHNREIKMSRRNDRRTNEWTSLSAERDVPSGNELEISSSSSHLSWELISSCH